MNNNKIVYISKEDCEKRGLIRLENGNYYKLRTIEKYAINGYLDGAKYDVTTLLSTANTFYKDYYVAGIDRLSAINPSKIMVNGSGNTQQAQRISEAIDRYNRAIRVLPKQMLNIVKKVCCRDEEIINPRISKENEYIIHTYLRMLTLGLCLLTKHYSNINNKNYKTDGYLFVEKKD